MGGVFRYKYYSRDELEDASRRQGSRADGMDFALEKRRRKNYVAWMKELTKELRLPHIVLSTAIIYMHRYFALKVRLMGFGLEALSFNPSHALRITPHPTDLKNFAAVLCSADIPTGSQTPVYVRLLLLLLSCNVLYWN